MRVCALQGLLYLLQGPPEDSPPLVSLAAAYIQGHSLRMWRGGAPAEDISEEHEVGREGPLWICCHNLTFT